MRRLAVTTMSEVEPAGRTQVGRQRRGWFVIGERNMNTQPVVMHPDQVQIADDVVRTLIHDQFPQWRGLPVTPMRSTGTENALYRIGEELVARFPLHAGSVEQTRRSLEAEAVAARELLGQTPFCTPEPVAIGEPGEGYPVPWSVQTWVPGTVATVADPGNSLPFAEDLAEFIHALRAIDTRGRRFAGPGRGGNLPDHDGWMQTCFSRSDRLLDVARLRRMWAEFRVLPGGGPEVMSHRDLIPGNVLVTDGRLAGIIDVGGFGPADPALDLVAAWHLLEDEPRQALRSLLHCDDVEWERGKAWAFEQSMGLVWYYESSNPTMSRMGRRTLDRIQACSPV